MSDELPEGWAAVPLGELVRPSKEKAEPGTANGLPYLGMEHVEAATGRVLGHGDASEVRSTTAVYRAGDVLYGKLRPYLNKVAVAPFDGVGSTEFIVFAQQEHLDSRYLRWLLSRRDFVEIANERAAGVQLPRVTFDKLADLKQPLPPIAEQRRIAATVESLLEQVRRAKNRLDRVPLILRRFRQAVLAAACEGRLTEEWRRERVEESAADMLVKALELRRARQPEAAAAARAEGRRQPAEPVSPIPTKEQVADLPDLPDCWSWALLPGLGELGRGRSRHRPRDAKHLYGGLHPFIQTGDIARSEGRITTHSQTYSDAGLAQSRLWPSGTVAITIAANIANSAVLTYPACFPDSVVGFIAEPSLCLPNYVEFFVRTVRERLDEFAPATAQKNINLETLREVVVALPPLAEQEEIVRRVSGLFALAAAIEQRVERATARAGGLLQAILSKAFAGELVPTEADLARAEGRGYETAEQLLERGRKQAMPQDAKKPSGRPGSRRISGSFGTAK